MERSESDREPPAFSDLTEVIRIARRGLKSDVAELVRAMETGAFLVPLAQSIEDVPVGEMVDAGDKDVSLIPHLLPDQDGKYFVPLFTDDTVLLTVGDHLDWSTETAECSGAEEGDDSPGELQYCTLPAKVALDLALQLIDEEEILALVINPSDEHELMLSRTEAATLVQGRPLPLVGYVREIPLCANEEPLLSELEEPPSEELTDALDRCVASWPSVSGYRLQQTFNEERDLEPHLTVTLTVDGAVDPEQLNEALERELEGKVPPPGYVDVLLEDEPEATSQGAV